MSDQENKNTMEIYVDIAEGWFGNPHKVSLGLACIIQERDTIKNIPSIVIYPAVQRVYTNSNWRPITALEKILFEKLIKTENSK
jgi:hypothetical protein